MKKRLKKCGDKLIRLGDAHIIARSECCLYFVFILIFFIMAVTSRGWSPNVYFASKGLTDQIIGGHHGEVPFYIKYDDGSESLEFEWKMITSKPAIYKYLKHVLIPSLLSDTNYDSTTNRFIHHDHSVLLGGIRLRIYKDRKDTDCRRDNVDFNNLCYENKQNKSNMIIGNIEMPFKTTSENREIPYLFGLHKVYPGSGQTTILPLNKTESLSILDTLENSGEFLDGSTRLLSIDFSLFNPTLTIHTIARIWFEMSHTGDIEELFDINTWQFLRKDDYLFITFQILFVIFVILWTMIELHQICISAEKYFLQGWNIVDCISLFFYWISVIIEILQWIDEFKTNFTSIDVYQSLIYSQFLVQLNNYFLIITGFIIFIRLFKYFKASQRLSFLFELFDRSAIDIFIVFFIIFIIILAFGLSGYLFLSPNVFEFRSIWFAMGNLCRFIVSSMDYNKITLNHPIFGAIFFVIWHITIILILSNVFIAILSQSYVEIAEKRNHHEKHEEKITHVIANWTRRIIKKKINDKDKTFKDVKTPKVSVVDNVTQIVVEEDTDDQQQEIVEQEQDHQQQEIGQVKDDKQQEIIEESEEVKDD